MRIILFIISLLFLLLLEAAFLNSYWSTIILCVCLFIWCADELTIERYRARCVRRIEKFYKKNKIRFSLKNNNIILKLVINRKFHLFYCIDRKSNKSFQFGGNGKKVESMVEIMWGLLDMKFKDSIDYEYIIKLFEKIYPKNSNYPKTGSPYIYFREDILPNVNNSTENNYKLKLKNNNSDKRYTICYEIEINKASKKKKKRDKKTGRKYVIQAKKSTITEIYYEYKYGGINDFYTSYEYFSKRNDCRIKFHDVTIKNVDKNNSESAQTPELIDINKIVEAEFVKLPGVNVILAKRIVKYREEIDGFKNKEQFYEYCKFKPHFIEQIDNLITVGEFDILDVILREDELTVDLIEDYEDKTDSDNYDDGDEIIVDL